MQQTAITWTFRIFGKILVQRVFCLLLGNPCRYTPGTHMLGSIVLWQRTFPCAGHNDFSLNGTSEDGSLPNGYQVESNGCARNTHGGQPSTEAVASLSISPAEEEEGEHDKDSTSTKKKKKKAKGCLALSRMWSEIAGVPTTVRSPDDYHVCLCYLCCWLDTV